MTKNNPKRRGLGRGLGSLIVNTESGIPPSDRVIEQAEAGDVRLISVDTIQPNPHQPRTNFDETALTELTISIREHDILQLLIVTKPGNSTPIASHEQGDIYWLVAGERRWRAAQLADLKEVPVIVRETTPQQLMEWALVENIQRADLNPLEEASAYQALITELNMTQAEVADRVDKSRSAVANILRLQTLPLEAQNSLLSNLISAGWTCAGIIILTRFRNHQSSSGSDSGRGIIGSSDRSAGQAAFGAGNRGERARNCAGC